MNQTPQHTYATAGTRGATPAATPSQPVRAIRSWRQAAARILASVPVHDEEEWIAHATVSPRDQELAAAAVAEPANARVCPEAGDGDEKKGGLEIILDEPEHDAIPVIGADSFLAEATRRPRGKVPGVFTRQQAGGLVGIAPEHHDHGETHFVADGVSPEVRVFETSDNTLPWRPWDVRHQGTALKATGTCVARSTRTMDRLWRPSGVKRG